MRKQIHVNSYVKKDGTEVKEHYRIINTDNYGVLTTLPEDGDNVKIEERSPETLGEILNYSTITGASPVLQGGVSMDVGYPVTSGGGIGDIFGGIAQILGTVLATGFELTPLALQMLQAMNGGNIQASEYLKPQFDNKIKQLDTQVIQIKQNIDKIVPKLINAKNQTEYAKLYKPLLKEYQAYQVASKLLNKIKAHANNGNYQEVANEIENFTNENFNQSVKMPTNIYQNNQFNIGNQSKGMIFEESMMDTFGQVISKGLKVAGSNLQNARNDFSYAKKNPHAHIINSRTEVINQSLNKLMDEVEIPKDSRGVIYDNNSEQSKLLWNSPEIQDFIKMNLQDLISGNAKEVYDIEFIIKQHLKGIDNFMGLQHCKLFKPQITSDGYFKGIIIDYYDFEFRPLEGSLKKIMQNYIILCM